MFPENKFLKCNVYSIAFCLFVMLFILLKLPVLHTPYYWDEIGVYVPGMREIVRHQTIGIMPADLDPLYSRGHPMLFFFIGATNFKIFGDNIVTGHLLAIAIAVSTLIALYKMCTEIYSERVGLIVAIVLSCQPVFFAMAGILLPEMLLALCGIISVWGILCKRWTLFAIGGSLAILTKESGTVFLVLACCVLFVDSVRSGDFFTRGRWKQFFYGAIPILVFATFFIIQKIQHGWYFFPEHIGLMHFDFYTIRETVQRIFFQLFADQGRWFLSIVLLVGITFFNKQIFSGITKRILFISLALVLISTIFCSVNYFIHRYQLYVYPYIILIAVLALEKMLEKFDTIKWPFITVPFLIVSCGLGYSHMNDHCYHDTYSMTYRTTINCVQKYVLWAEAHPLPGSMKVDFPIEQAMEEKANGYTHRHFRLRKGWDDKPDFHCVFFLDGEQVHNPWNFDSVVQKFDLEFAHIRLLTQKKCP